MVERIGRKEIIKDDVDLSEEKKKEIDLRREIVEPKIRRIVNDAMSVNSVSTFLLSRDLQVKKVDQIVDYIIEGNLGSKKDTDLEKFIGRIAAGPFAWKLKFLIDNSESSLEMILFSIDDKEKKIREKNLNKLIKLEQESAKYRKSQEKGVFEKGWDWLMDKVDGIGSSIVSLIDVPEKIGGVIGDVLARAEEYIGKVYVHGSMDCSMFLSKIFCAGQGVKEHRLGTSGDFAKYEKVSRDKIRCGDVIYQAKPAHVELIVSKPYVEGGVTYVNTIGSSTDKNNVDPMFDADGNPIKNRTGVGYRKRQIAPNPRHHYTYHRPPYEEWANKRA